jgi:hypothetical protein
MSKKRKKVRFIYEVIDIIRRQENVEANVYDEWRGIAEL